MSDTVKKNSFIDSVSDLVTKMEILFSEDKPADLKFMDYKLATGEIVRTDTETVGTGTAISIIAEDGTEAPLIDGTYQLIVDEKNVIEVVVVAGMVETATPKEVEAETPADAPEDAPVEEEEMATEVSEERMKALEDKVLALEAMCKEMGMNAEKLASMEAQYNEVNTKYSDITSKYTEIENNYNSVKSLNEKLVTEKTQLKSLFEQMFALMKEIGNTSQNEPTHAPKEKQFRKQEPIVFGIDVLQKQASEYLNKINTRD